jgi:hypothetical protein
VRHAAQGPIIRPECASRGVPVDGLLRAMRTGHHARFDRVVFEFCGSRVPPHRIAYVDEVRRDPSDRALPLHGRAFLSVVVDGGTTNTAPIATDPAAAPRYRGPDRLTPRHPLVADVAIAGDFERGDESVLGQFLGQPDVVHHAHEPGDDGGRLALPGGIDRAMSVHHGHHDGIPRLAREPGER